MNNYSYGNRHTDADWGAEFVEVLSAPNLGNIFVGHVTISDLNIIANKMSEEVVDTSWISKLDISPRRSYERTAGETAKKLVEISS